MNDDQLLRTLQSVGQTCFVRYFDAFYSQSMSREDVIEKLRNETGYTEKSCTSRTGHARSIINAGLSIKALETVISSNSPRISQETKMIAGQLIKSLNT